MMIGIFITRMCFVKSMGFIVSRLASKSIVLISLRTSQSTNYPKNKPDDVGENKMSKKPLAILLVVLFVLTVTASAVSAMPCDKNGMNKHFSFYRHSYAGYPNGYGSPSNSESCASCGSDCSSGCDSCSLGACDSGSCASCGSGCASGSPSYGSRYASNYGSCDSGSCGSGCSSGCDSCGSGSCDGGSCGSGCPSDSCY